jgi:hypothetical protein
MDAQASDAKAKIAQLQDERAWPEAQQTATDESAGSAYRLSHRAGLQGFAGGTGGVSSTRSAD